MTPLPAFLDQPLTPRGDYLSRPQRLRACPDFFVEKSVRFWWPRLDTRAIAARFYIPEARVANMLARIRDAANA